MTPVAKSIVAFLKENKGYPVTPDDLKSQGVASAAAITKSLKKLALDGYIYITDGYVYPTVHAEQVDLDQLPIEAYDEVLTPAEGSSYETREDVYTALQEHFKTYYDHYVANHPEYDRFFKWVEDSPDAWKTLATESIGIIMRWTYHQDAGNTFVGEAEYVTPPDLNTIEAAIDAEVQRFKQHMPYFNHLFEDRAKYKAAYDDLREAKVTSNAAVVEKLQGIETGTIIVPSKIESLVRSELSSYKSVGSTKDSMIATIASEILQNLRETAPHLVSTAYEPGEIADVLFGSYPTDFVTAWNNYIRSSQGARLGTDKANQVFGMIEQLPDDLAGIDLTGITVSEKNFAGKNLNKASFQNCVVEFVDFTGADMRNVHFDITSCRECSFEGTDFEGATVEFDNIAWDSITGTPLNLASVSIDTNNANLSDVLSKGVSMTSSTIPLTADELDGAKVVARALQGFLQKHISFSSLQSTSALEEDAATQLRAWLDGGDAPTFDFGGNLISWLQAKNKTQELREAGFSGKEVNKMFGMSRNVSGKPKVNTKELKAKEDQARIDKFISTHADATELPAKDLIELLNDQASNLHYWIEGFGETLNQQQIFSLYTSLVSTLKEFHVPGNIKNKMKRGFEAFPYSSYISDLSNTRHNVAGSGKQFGVALTPNYSVLPDRLRGITQLAVTEGSSHLENAVCFARIEPMEVKSREFTPEGSADGANKTVWFITEMQADDYQKLGSRDGNIRNKVIKKYGEEAIKEYRRFYRHWPETMLSAIVDLANRSGVDELWMPEHTEVEAKTNNGKTSTSHPGDVPNWYNGYDRPAKAFGGELGGTGEPIELDSNSGYSRMTNEAYKIPLGSSSVQADLSFNPNLKSLLKFGDLSDYDWEHYKELLAHHINFIYDNNVEQFEDVKEYVTREMMAQLGWTTFFDEYPEVKQAATEDPEVLAELKRLFEEDLGYKLYDPPFIDWFHWMRKALDDVKFFITNQQEISPDLNLSNQELARDWYQLWQEEQLPSDIAMSSWFKTVFEPTLQSMFVDKGFGDILSTDFILPPTPEEKDLDLLFNPPDNNEGEGELMGMDGQAIDPSEDSLFGDSEFDFENLDFGNEDPDQDAELVDTYLEMLQDAIRDGDDEIADDLRKRLKEITSQAGLQSLAWHVPEPGSDPDHSFTKESYEFFYSNYGSAKFRSTGIKGRIITTLGDKGPTSLIDMWRDYVVEVKKQDPATLPKTSRGDKPYYQGMSSSATGLKHYGIVSAEGGVYSLTAYGYEVFKAGAEGGSYSILPPDDPALEKFYYTERPPQEEDDTELGG